MKKMKFNTVATRTVAAGCVIGLFMAAQAASACTLQNWSVPGSGDVEPGSPVADPANGVVDSARYSGLCAMAANGQGFVEDTSPGSGGLDRIRARFYVLADNTQDALIYEGLNGSTSIFTVEIGADGAVTLSGNGISAPLTAPGVSGNWNSIEVDWNAGGNQVSLWVNSDASSDVADASESVSTGQVVTSVRLGNLDGASGALSFDAYESRRSTAVGRLLVGDANSDGAVDVLDINTLANEILNSELGSGVPDCDESGTVDVLDVNCMADIILG